MPMDILGKYETFSLLGRVRANECVYVPSLYASRSGTRRRESCSYVSIQVVHEQGLR